MIPDVVFQSTILELLSPLRAYLEDPTVSEVLINGPDRIFIERRGRLSRVPETFPEVRILLAALRAAAQFVGKRFDAEEPILEGRLPDGSRIVAVLPPAAPQGPCVAIRRFYRDTLTMARLLDFGALTEEVAEALAAIVGAKLNVIIAGGTATGKTSMLSALASYIPEDERVVVIEDAQELSLKREHLVQFEARPPDPNGRGEVTIRSLFRTTLRMRPDRIVIGEIRGGEALDVLQAMTSGHGGCLTTLHATYPRDVLLRLETMASMNELDLPLSALRAQIASAVHIIVQVGRMRSGQRHVTHVAEVSSDATRGVSVRNLFRRTGYEDPSAPAGRLERTHVPARHAHAIRERGVPLPPSLARVGTLPDEETGSSG